MSNKFEKLEHNMVKISMEIGLEEFDKACERAYQKNKNQISLPGFRKGKAPRKMIERVYGKEVFYEDALNDVLPDIYTAAVEELKLDVVSRPEVDVEKMEAGEPIVVTATVAVKPEVTLGEYKGLVAEKETVAVTEDDVNEELKKDYHLVVLDYNFNNRFEELDKIEDKERCEILVNAVCIPDCPRRGEHYKNIARNQRIMLKNRKLPADKQIPLEKWYCEYGEMNCIHTIQNYSTYISPEAIWEKYVPMGFSNFKIEGRTANLFSLVETYCHYLVRPEYQGQARILLLNNLAANKVITVNHPRPRKWVPET